MNATGAVQGALSFGPATSSRCRLCGRDWPGVFDLQSADLGAFLHLPPDDFLAATRCWFGRCTEAPR